MSHETIERFKLFVRNHPGLIQEVRNERRTWQELYEEWYLLGEDATAWEKYKKSSVENRELNWIPEIMEKVKNVDLNDVQKKIADMRGLVGNIQQLVSDFKPKEKTPPSPPRGYPYHHY